MNAGSAGRKAAARTSGALEALEPLAEAVVRGIELGRQAGLEARLVVADLLVVPDLDDLDAAVGGVHRDPARDQPRELVPETRVQGVHLDRLGEVRLGLVALPGRGQRAPARPPRPRVLRAALDRGVEVGERVGELEAARRRQAALQPRGRALD